LKIAKKLLKGFTLIELIVVISIIGILTTLVIVNYSSTKAKARDSKRKQDIATYQSALEAYFDDYDVYPDASNSYQAANIMSGCKDTNNDSGCGIDITNNEYETVYIHTLLEDPLVQNIHGAFTENYKQVSKNLANGDTFSDVSVYFRYAYTGGGASPSSNNTKFGTTTAFSYLLSAGIENPNDNSSVRDREGNVFRYSVSSTGLPKAPDKTVWHCAIFGAIWENLNTPGGWTFDKIKEFLDIYNESDCADKNQPS